MTFLRSIAQVLLLLGIALYLGGMVALGAIAAPVLFNTVREVQATSPQLPAGPDASQQLGGEIFGNILRRFAVVELVSLGLIVVAMTLQSQSPAWRGKWGWTRGILVAALVGVAAFDLLHVTPAIWEERGEWREAIASSSKSADGYRARFDALHRESEILGQVKVYLLLGLLGVVGWHTGAQKGVGHHDPREH